MLHAIKSLKQNRDLLKSRRAKNRMGNSANGDVATKIEFKEVSPEELQKIKEAIRAKAKISKRKDLVLGIVIVAGIVMLVLGLLLFGLG